MAVITIDGTRLEVPENKNVLECALEAGIYIPHLCHHPDLPENGSCRMFRNIYCILLFVAITTIT